jgi:23S rRNA pseudouridine2605 synthase
MPRKSKKNPEPETAEPLTTSADESQAPEETASPAKKAVRKKRTKKTAEAPASESVGPVGGKNQVASDAEAEAAAHAADTFEDAFETHGPAEAHAHEAEVAEAQAASDTAVPKKPRKAKAIEIEEEEPASAPVKQERLQKILAQAGIASRRHAEELITQGRVQVNGQVVTTLGSKADAARDHIRVDGKLLHGAERLRYFVLNKPRGFVTTVSDPEGRPTVMEFFAKMNERLYPVGRLDYLSEGLLLVTNDGDLANKLTRAASGVEKTYLVKVSGQPTEEQILTLREGVSIDREGPGEGRVRTAPARIRAVRAGENPWFEVVLIEGRNRELRKMFEEIGHFVEKIRRVGYGPLVLDVEPGKFRELDPEELHALRLTAEGKWKPKRVRTSDMLPREAGRTVDLEAGKRGKKPFRAQPRREAGSGERREFRGGADRTGQRGVSEGARRAFPGGPLQGSARGEARRPEWKQNRLQGERPRFERPAAGAGLRGEGGGGVGRGGEGRAQGDFARPRPPQGRGFAKPAGERAGFGRGEERRGPRPPRAEWGVGREQAPRGPARGQERGQGFGPPRGERREFARPPRDAARPGAKPSFRPERPRVERPSQPRGEERRPAESRPSRPAAPGARPQGVGAQGRPAFGRPARPDPRVGSRPGSRPPSSRGPRPGSSGGGSNRGGSTRGPRPGAKRSSGPRGSNRGGGPKRRP